MKEENNLLNKIMESSIGCYIRSLYIKYKEAILYLFFGGLAFLLNMFLFAILINVSIDELLANIIAWVITVIFAYVTNTIWVFSARPTSFKSMIIQICQFFSGRIITLIIEEVLLLIFISIMGFNSIIVKFISQVIVIVMNYIISKIWVYRE